MWKNLLVLLGFLVFLTDGTKAVLPDANGVLFKDGHAVFVRVSDGGIELILAVPLGRLGLVVEIPGRMA